MMTQADVSKLGYVGRQPSRKRNSDSWFTPESYLSSVRTVLGEITLDPFSDKQANEIVGATHYFDEDTDGLRQDWDVANSCKVFMNPPYSAGMMKQCCDKFVDAWNREQFDAGIVLVNNATETKWFHKLLSKASAVCFTDHRISFWNVDGKVVSNNTRGQAFFYFGNRADVFNKVFKTHGYCQELTSNYNGRRRKMSHEGNEILLEGLYESCMEFLRRQYPCLTEDELEEISAKIARARFREYE